LARYFQLEEEYILFDLVIAGSLFLIFRLIWHKQNILFIIFTVLTTVLILLYPNPIKLYETHSYNSDHYLTCVILVLIFSVVEIILEENSKTLT